MSVSETRPIAIEDELKSSYLDYAMSVIVSRALPDVRDGLKPVHRRVLFAMHELGNDYNKAYKKSARVVGDVIGKYHPHGDSAVYETIVRMAQDFSLRYQLVDGQGNFGSVDGDSAAAMRYTEVRMRKLTHEILADLEKDTVEWEDNYDGSERIPQVMPTRIPNLLINGVTGIAVGMATNMAPHNLTEVINACLAYANNPNISVEGLMEHVTGPDFPTGGIIYGKSGIVDAYRTGKGRLHIRGKYHFEEDQKTGRTTIVFTEIPYQVNKAKTIERIAELVKEKKLEGISELRDESDKDGMRIAIDLKRGENAEVIVNNLFLNTQLENSFSINMVCLDNGQPKLMNLKDIVAAFIRHRQEVVTRRTMFELRKARERGHILEGGNVVALLEKAGAISVRPDEIEGEDPNRPFGLDGLVYRLSPAQVGAILELRLHRLTGLEQDKLQAEYSEILAQIAELTAILNDFNLLMGVIKEELALILQQYGDGRRTEIVESRIDFSREDLIPEEQVPLSDYAAQRRGGRGKSATSMKEDDYIQHLIVTSNHATVLCFTNVGKVYRLKVFEVPQASRGAKGRPMVNLLPLDADETITAILPVIDAPKKFTERLTEFRSFVRTNVAKLRENAIIDSHYEALKAAFAELGENPDDLSDALRKQLKEIGLELSASDLDDELIAEFAERVESVRKNFYVFMATASGTVKRVELEQFSNVRSNGLRAIELKEEDTLIGVAITDGEQQIMLFSNEGKAIRFSETDARVMGRTAKGVRGMRVSLAAAQAEEDSETDVDSDDEDSSDLNIVSRIVSLVVVPETGEVLCASANGYGKRTPVDDFPTKKRGGKGVIAIKTSERNGELVGAVAIDASKELMLISDGGTLVRTRASEVARTGRNAQGVRLIRLGNEEVLVGVVAVEAVEEELAALVDEDHADSSEQLIDAEKLVDEETIMDEGETESDEGASEE
ncbi:hypothetical protein FQR65_LT17382 [Abscondita terminalis]|nr:hypothetical protein FQR65_LT17382 [Abscondita terminalis]